MAMTQQEVEQKALAVALRRTAICTPRGKHRPVQSTLVKTPDMPPGATRMRYLYCADCESWYAGEAVYSQATVRA